MIVSFFAGCKKDLLHLHKVQRLNSNTSCTIDNIRFITNDICIAAGGTKYDQSLILRSTDGGFTWSAYNDPNAPKEMYGMGVGPNGTIYLSGIDGYVLHSADSGRNWKSDQISNWLGYVGGSFIAADTGIFVSTVLQRQCTITRITAGFKTIDEQSYLLGANDIYMAGHNTAYLVGYGAVMKTTDQGNTWNFQDIIGDNFNAMDIHGNEIWMCGFNGGVFHTNDGGNSWTTLRNGSDISLPRLNFLDIKFKDSKNGWAVCDDGRLVRSNDGGYHWMEYDRFTTSALRSLVICPNGDLLAGGDNGVLFRITE